MARYGTKVKEDVEKEMHKLKKGKLKSGKSRKTVKSPKQAIAIGLSEARKKGKKVPAPKRRAKSKASTTRSKSSSAR